MTTTAILPETNYSAIAEMIASRAERGEDLYLRKRRLIQHVSADEYLVPGSTGQRYVVHYGAGREDCDCTDFSVHGGQLACKHLVMVALQFATRRKVQSRCSLCGVGSHEKTLVGLRGDRRRNGERWCLAHHPSVAALDLL